jgi:hypothetical protein
MGRSQPLRPDTTLLSLFVLVAAVQAIHMLEEHLFHFGAYLPALWGDLFFGDPTRYRPWSVGDTLTGGLSMSAFWLGSMALLPTRSSLANYGAVMFIGSMLSNGIFHPIYNAYLLLSPRLQDHVMSHGLSATYFPGFFTAWLHLFLAGHATRRLLGFYRRNAIQR